jgi:glucosamine--fructose-6-phosphate aminotransferase (isomerizing)
MVMNHPGDVMLSEIRETPNMLRNLVKSFDSNVTAQNLFKTHDFQSVIILARGTSDNAAHFLKYLIEIKLGLPAGLASPSAATMYSAKFKYQKTLIVALSQSGQSADLIAFANAAKAGSGYVLSITNAPDSPLAQISDLHIPINAGPERAVPATKSYVGQLFVSFLLVNAWSENAVNVDQLISSAENWCESTSKIDDFAAAFDITKPVYVLGRGYSYPNAKEFALKLQETSLIPVQGMSSSDFLHGPIASLRSDSQVIFIAPIGTPKDSFGESCARIREITGKVFWVGTSDLSKENDIVLQGNRAETEVEASIADAIAFQLITHKVATLNGLNPDSPRGLNKITITR